MRRPQFHCIGPVVLDRVIEVDRIPGPDDKAFVKSRSEAAGGPARNVAEALAGWGCRVTAASLVGDDAIGQRLLDRLSAAGVGTETVERLPDVETASCTIIVDARGERAILIDPIDTGLLADIGRGVRPEPGDAVLANLFHDHAAVDALARGRAAGAVAFVDLEWPEISRWGWPAALHAAAAADVAVTNAQVLRGFADRNGLRPDDDAAIRLARELRPAGGRVCVTLGAAGVLARDGDRLIRLAAMPVSPTNTTGAGDRFLAALARALVTGAPFEAALSRAVAAAGLYLAGTAHGWADIEAAARALPVHGLETGALS